jgi:hypothetical protein
VSTQHEEFPALTPEAEMALHEAALLRRITLVMGQKQLLIWDLPPHSHSLLEMADNLHAPETHYEWELTDANGEWQAGGSANEYPDADNEAMRYLTQYPLDGKHTVTIRKHETTTTSVACIGGDAEEVKP